MSILPRCICDPLDAMIGKYDPRCCRHLGVNPGALTVDEDPNGMWQAVEDMRQLMTKPVVSQKPAELTDKRELAFQGLIDAVSSAPLTRLRPTAYMRETNLGPHYTAVPPAHGEQATSLYTFAELQKAYAMGRADDLAEKAERLKSQRLADVEYRSWFKGGLFRKMRRMRQANQPKTNCGYPSCGCDTACFAGAPDFEMIAARLEERM